MNRMAELRREKGISMKQAAELLGLPYTTYVNYEKGTREPKSDTLISIAHLYNTSIDYMLGKSDTRIDNDILDIVNTIDQDLLEKAGNIRDALRLQSERDGGMSVMKKIPPGYEPLPDMSRVPRVGRIACGQPILAEENIEDYDSIPSSWRADFTLICVGDSMSPRILDGDMVAIHKQPCVENGQIAVVRIENEATLKRVYLYPDRMVLQPENQAYAPIVLVGEEMNTVSIEGKAVGLCRVIV